MSIARDDGAVLPQQKHTNEFIPQGRTRQKTYRQTHTKGNTHDHGRALRNYGEVLFKVVDLGSSESRAPERNGSWRMHDLETTKHLQEQRGGSFLGNQFNGTEINRPLSSLEGSVPRVDLSYPGSTATSQW